jgi:hypothetical protein
VTITLAQAFERVAGGAEPEGPLSEFVHGFLQTEASELRLSLIIEAPRPTGQKHLDALAGAIAEYLAKHFRLPSVPPWAGEPGRFLERPWHVLLFNDGRERRLPRSDEGLREFLTFCSPAEFRPRNIFTDEAPLTLHFAQRSERGQSLQ